MLIYFTIIICNCIINTKAYRNNLYTIMKNSDARVIQCRGSSRIYSPKLEDANSAATLTSTTELVIDPFFKFQKTLDSFLFGRIVEGEFDTKISQLSNRIHEDTMFKHYPSGSILRGELLNNMSMVHLPFAELMHRGHIYLRVTEDSMQTAVNAFSIFLEGDEKDILRLPPDYVLRSSRTIAMMNIPHEKLAATWTVVKHGMDPVEVSYEILEMFRPLFKYVNGREIARLNLSDTRILNYIGTHPDLNRHQVGVVANTYIEINPNWRESRYLNIMNNLICGVPMVMMRTISESTFLQLTPQIFYHIRACDVLQRRFLLGMMSRSQVLGKSYSWSARDVSRLGLLLTVLHGPELGAIKPKAMNGITSQVMVELSPNTLKYITEAQLEYIKPKSLNILARKLKQFNDEMSMVNKSPSLINLFRTLTMFIIVIKN